jgi:hypothetical protein
MQISRRSDRSITAQIDLPAPMGDSTHLEVSVSYAKGGISYWDYKTYPDAYWLTIKPVRVEGPMLSYMLGKGMRSKLEESGRFNRKKLEALWAEVANSIKVEGSQANNLYKAVTMKEAV